VVSFSAGKDSGVCLELAIMAAGELGRLPVRVVMRDEEIMLPGTYEYAERVASRPEVDFRWLYACQPVLNVFNRDLPYFWVFDPALPPESWVRRPPKIARKIPHLNIQDVNRHDLWGLPETTRIWSVMGLRAAESFNRTLGIYSKHGWRSKGALRPGVFTCTPIYDWSDGDVWKFIRDRKTDYNHAYDVMHRMGVPRSKLRIAPPTMAVASMSTLDFARRAFPRWFESVCDRLPGVRTAAMFGVRAVTPQRRRGEGWEECFRRTCVQEAPKWIADRAALVAEHMARSHANHSALPISETVNCEKCGPNIGSWRALAFSMFNGDPFVLKSGSRGGLKYVEPEFFRPGTGTWGGTPSW
jgi:predicted phosphoadenosine phosphosulfate sulfurtransferase